MERTIFPFSCLPLTSQAPLDSMCGKPGWCMEGEVAAELFLQTERLWLVASPCRLFRELGLV